MPRIEDVKDTLRSQAIELPSWAFGNSGTRAIGAINANVFQDDDYYQRLLLEYKLFEPAFYTMDVPDWGTAYAHCAALGPKAMVVVDTGHHAPGTNIEFIVAVLLRTGKLGAFDLNSRFYADDDLMVGAADPFQLLTYAPAA